LAGAEGFVADSAVDFTAVDLAEVFAAADSTVAIADFYSVAIPILVMSS